MAQVQVQAQAIGDNNNNNNNASYPGGLTSVNCHFGSTGIESRLQEEDASETLVFVLNGGPKWGFRIKQLNDNRVIVSRIDRGPAERSGLRVYDEILSVNNVELLDSPRSLLLLDYPDQFSPTLALSSAAAAAAAGAGAVNGGNPPSSGSLGEKTPLLAQAAASASNSAQLRASHPVVALGSPALAAAAAAAAASASKIELSKLDFAYQLIKHSSASNNNKLVLSVRRFLDFAYARASALAASNMLTAGNFSSSNHYRPSIADLMTTTGGGPLPLANQGPPPTARSSNSLTLQQYSKSSLFGTAGPRRAHTSSGTSNVYKCCDCYCDKGGKLS